MINKLYGLLVDGYDVSTSWYKKTFSVMFHTNKTKSIQKLLLTDTPTNRIGLLACVICYESKFTRYGAEIGTLDPNNSYHQVCRNPNNTTLDTGSNLYDITKAANKYNELLPYLDADIKDSLVVPTWIDVMAAGSLQMLRETL